MKHQIISSIALPTLLILIGTLSFFTIKQGWNFELTSYIIFLFTFVYILILERIIPLKEEWKLKKSVLWSDIKHLIFSVAIFDALGKMIALSLVLFAQEYFFKISDFWKVLPFFITFIIDGIKNYPDFNKVINSFKFNTLTNKMLINDVQFYVLKNEHSFKQSFAYFKDVKIIYQGDFLEIPADNSIATHLSNV